MCIRDRPFDTQQNQQNHQKLTEYISGQIKKESVKYTAAGGKAYEFMGFVQQSPNSEESLKNYQQAQEIYAKVHGEHSLQMAELYHRLGSYYFGRNEFEKSLEYYTKSLELRISLLGPDNPILGENYSSIGQIYHHQNDSQNCDSAFHKCLELFEKGFGQQSLLATVAYYNMGILEKWHANYEESEKYFLKAYEIKKDKLGEAHISLGRDCMGLSTLYSEVGRYEEATKYFYKGLLITEQNKDEPLQALNLYSLGDVCLKSSKYKDSFDNYEKAYKIRLKLLGDKHNETQAAFRGVCEAKNKLGKVDEAVEGFKTYVEAQAQIFGKESNTTAWAHWFRACFYYDIGLYNEANNCLLYTSPSPRDRQKSRMPSSA
eukprot:TRINITY_DN3991_c0_g1_i1.p1 TRINITY_DN3991_c0_g1~~TRINITY_DN3991_c0_g1_i1.p1  ORF type:complete len:374 (+),score=59.12 TRINITY_DN3991_c0_g1_i1:65-1186(+)